MGYQSDINSLISTIGTGVGIKKHLEQQGESNRLQTEEISKKEELEKLKNKAQGVEMQKQMIDESLKDPYFEGRLKMMKSDMTKLLKKGKYEEANGISEGINYMISKRVRSVKDTELYKIKGELAESGDMDTYLKKYFTEKAKMDSEEKETIPGNFTEKLYREMGDSIPLKKVEKYVDYLIEKRYGGKN